jgi:hypothetical protein
MMLAHFVISCHLAGDRSSCHFEGSVTSMLSSLLIVHGTTSSSYSATISNHARQALSIVSSSFFADEEGETTRVEQQQCG